MRRHRAIGSIVTTLLVAVAIAVVSATPSSASGGEVSDYYSRINGLRAQHGLAPLQIDPGIAAGAQSWAAQMASSGTIYHSDLNSWFPAGATKVAENVGMGPDNPSIFQAFVDSPSHLANLLDPGLTHMGVGVAYNGSQQFTAHRFAAFAPAPPPPPPPPPPTTAPPPPAPPPPTTVAPPPSTTTTTTAPPPEPVPTPADPERVAVVLGAIRVLG